ncbi:proteasome beta 2 subunit [Trypanosoma cruzi]|nr:proteasome beta 2 subunit [Trypanosoma cruzi]
MCVVSVEKNCNNSKFNLVLRTYSIVQKEEEKKGKSRIMPGFSFANVQRNLNLQRQGLQPPKTLKTGTTIVGVVYKEGVVLGADTRATEGSIVADKRCKKIHYMAPNIMCCGAGTAADTEAVTNMVSANLALHRLDTGKQSRVHEALTMLKRHLYRYQGHVSAALVLGGVDVEGPFLATVAPHGSTDRLPFVSMGSGSIAAMSALETGYKENMTLEEAKELVASAIRKGIFNDPYSGTQVDLCVITKTKTELLIGYDKPNERKYPKQEIRFPPGTTPVLREEIRQLVTITDVE